MRRAPIRGDRGPSQRHPNGFTLVELMVVAALILFLTLVGFPAFSRFIHQSRLRTFVQESSVLLSRARTEAVMKGAPVVALPRPDKRDFFVYVNVDGDARLEYQPDPSAPARTADYSIGVVSLPGASRVNYHGPADRSPNGSDITEGLTEVEENGNRMDAFVFDPDGSVRDIGGVRIGDDRGNFFELRAEPKATGRAKVLKYNHNPSWGDPEGFFEAGNDPDTGKPLWVWY